MKPIFLTIEGLHSFRDKQEIDFEQLSDAGVFGIFGPTGSGKSTILDAITLALYGSVGRAKNRTQGILNHAEKSLNVSFQFAIGACSDRKMYRIDRRYDRNTDTTVKNKYSRLCELDANQEELIVLANKDGEVTNLVEEILGLKLEDFTRAVVLPQGKFADFLQLEGKKRREMLQRLFSLERFGFQLNQRLNNRHQNTKQALELIVAEQNGMGDCSKKALEQAEMLKNEAIEKEQEANLAYTKIQKEFETAKQILEWQEQLYVTNVRLEQHKEDEIGIKTLQTKIEWSEKADKVMPLVKRLEDTQQEVQKYEQAQANLATIVEALQVDTEKAKAIYESALQEQKRKSPELFKRQTQLDVAIELEQDLVLNNQDIEKTISQHTACQGQYSELTADIERLLELQAKYTVELQNQKEDIQRYTVTPEDRAWFQQVSQKNDIYQNICKDLSEKKTEEKRRANELYDALGLVQKCQSKHEFLLNKWNVLDQEYQEQRNNPPTTEDQLAKLEGQLTVSKAKTKMLLKLEHATQLDFNRIADLENEIQNVSNKVIEISQALEKANKELMSLNQQHQQAVQQDYHVMAAILAANLKDGEACLVCGSKSHPHPVIVKENTEERQTQESNEIEQLVLAIQTVTAKVKELSEQETNEKMEIRLKQEKINDIQAAIHSRQEQIEDLLLQIHADLQIKSNMGTKLETGQQMIEQIEKEWEQLEQQREKWVSWKRSIDTLQIQLDEVKQELAGCQSQLAGYKQKVEMTKNEHEAVIQVLQEKEKQVILAEKDLQEIVMQKGLDSVNAVYEDMQFKDEQLAIAIQLEKELQQQLTDIQIDWQEKNRTESNLRVQIAELAKTIENLRKTNEDKRTKWEEITAGRKAKELQQQIEQELNQLAENETISRQNYEQLSQQWIDTQRQLTQVNTRCEEVAIQYARAEYELKQKLKQENFITVQEVKDAILPIEELQNYKKQVIEHQDMGKALQSEKEKLIKNLDGKQISGQQWAWIQVELEASEKQKQEAISICGAAKLQYQNLLTKHTRWTELDNKRKNLDTQFKYLEQLKSILRGDRYIEYLAQEQLDFVAKQASNRLKSLTRNRYALELGDDGGFMMRDDANGGVRRPVTTLSGGETFLASLALALSLSTQIQLRGRYPLEFFFLDEGFGTLDAELLDVVMSTLEQLRLENMTIGIISHVPELQQRLHRRLLVEPAEAAGRGSRVRIERM